MVQDEYQFGGSDRDIWSGTVSAGQVYSGSYSYTVPAELGTYNIDYRTEFGSSRTKSGGYRLTIEVIEEPPNVVPTPPATPVATETPVASGTTGDGTGDSYTSTGDKVEAVMLNGSIIDKVRMLISLILLYISDLLGGA